MPGWREGEYCGGERRTGRVLRGIIKTKNGLLFSRLVPLEPSNFKDFDGAIFSFTKTCSLCVYVKLTRSTSHFCHLSGGNFVSVGHRSWCYPAAFRFFDQSHRRNVVQGALEDIIFLVCVRFFHLFSPLFFLFFFFFSPEAQVTLYVLGREQEQASS